MDRLFKVTDSGQTNAEGNHLHSELAKLCLPSTYQDRNQKLAWVNSICLSYLLIGLIGLKPPAPVLHSLRALEAPVITPLDTPSAALVQDQLEDAPEEPSDQTDKPAMVAVVVNTPEVAFSVPTLGNVLVPSKLATAPPLKPMNSPAPTETNRLYAIGLTGSRGARPAPDYPQEFIRARMTGTVVLLIYVDASGVITDVQVEKSSGHRRLDEHTVNHVKRRFTFPAAEGPRVYQLPVGYQL